MQQDPEEKKLIWTYTDEAPALATYSLLPLIRPILEAADVNVQKVDISLAGRILAAFADRLPHKHASDDLAMLAQEVQQAKTSWHCPISQPLMCNYKPPSVNCKTTAFLFLIILKYKTRRQRLILPSVMML